MRTFVLVALAALVGALFVRNAIALGRETHPLVWVAAGGAALAGGLLFVLLLAHPPAVLEKLARGARRGLLPILAAGVAVFVIGSSSSEGQLISLSLFAGFLGAALAHGLLGRLRAP